MSLAIEKKQGKKHARDKCTHPTLLCPSGFSLEDCTDSGSICEYCGDTIFLDIQKCSAECGCSLTGATSDGESENTSDGESENTSDGKSKKKHMESGVTISGRWFKVFHDHELKQDHVEEDLSLIHISEPTRPY